jgi:hypothetical protein
MVVDANGEEGRRACVQTPIAKLKIATPVTMFLNRYGRLARFRAAPVR